MSKYEDQELDNWMDYIEAAIYTGQPSLEDCKQLKTDFEQYLVEVNNHLHNYKVEEVAPAPSEFNTCIHCEYFQNKDMCPKFGNIVGQSKICDKFLWDEIPF